MDVSVSETAKHNLTRIISCFTLGNLVFIRRWYDLENLQQGGLNYFRAAPAGDTLLYATLLAALLASAAFWFAGCLLDRLQSPRLRRIAQSTFLLTLIYPLESIRRYWNSIAESPDWGSNLALGLIEGLLLVGWASSLLGHDRILRASKRSLLLLSLLIPVILFDFLMFHLRAEPAEVFDPRPSATQTPASSNAHRLVWLLFDELDQSLAFDKRPEGLDLPELDRLRSESMAATQVNELADFTTIAIPSLLTGRKFDHAQALDANTLWLYPQGSKEAVDWRTQTGFFHHAHQLGSRSEIVGWHHPYCRLLGDQLVRCFALPSNHSTAAVAEQVRADREGLWSSVEFLYRLQFADISDLFRRDGTSSSELLKDTKIQREQQNQYFEIQKRALVAVSDSQVDVVFVHFPTPHLFPIYNRQRQNFDLTPDLDYLDNLALVDRTLGELRRALDQAGLSATTSILVTSDHGLRPGAWTGRLGWTAQFQRLSAGRISQNVPLLLKLAGDSGAAVYPEPLSAIVTADLATAVLSGAVTNNSQAASWLKSKTLAEVSHNLKAGSPAR